MYATPLENIFRNMTFYFFLTVKWLPVSQGVSKALQCPICLLRFRQPKMLPCMHRFCEECTLQVAPIGSKTISCPMCRKESSVPKGRNKNSPMPAILGESIVHAYTRVTWQHFQHFLVSKIPFPKPSLVN